MTAKIRFHINGVHLDDLHNLIMMVVTPMRIRNSAPEPKATTDEEIVVKKMMDAATKFTSGMQMQTITVDSKGIFGNFVKDHVHETALFLTPEQFKEMDKPNAGDFLEFSIRKVKTEAIKVQ